MKMTVSELAKKTTMVIHGGNDYKDEVAEHFKYGHPILTIDMGGIKRHFKCSSVDVKSSNKYKNLRQGFYKIQNPETCQLDKTFKAIRHEAIPVIDFNHSIYILNEETPPLEVYPSGDTRKPEDQTQFELSENDKIGVLRKIIEIVQKKGKIRGPHVSKEECIKADKKWNETRRKPPHPVQVLDTINIKLKLDDISQEVTSKFINTTMK